VTEGSTFVPQGPGEDNGGTVRGVLCMPLFRFFTQTLAPRLKLTTSAKATVVRGGVELRRTRGVRHTRGIAPAQGSLCVQRRGTQCAKPIVLLGKS